jgi:hypothetical protein
VRKTAEFCFKGKIFHLFYDIIVKYSLYSDGDNISINQDLSFANVLKIWIRKEKKYGI